MLQVNLALSGCGQLYVGYIGVLKALYEIDIRPAELTCCSGGSIIAAAIATGLEPGPELVKIAKKTLPFKNRLFDPSLRALFSRNPGFFRGDRIAKALAEHLPGTLSETDIPIRISTSNLSKYDLTILDGKSNPDLSLAFAVRASISLPFIFAPAVVNNNILVDGGLVCNLPMDHFNDYGRPTIGVRFINQKATNFFGSLINTVVSGNELKSMKNTPNGYLLDIPTTHSSLNFLIDDADVDNIIMNSYYTTKFWLKMYASELGI